jgi:hypothetical protein
MTGNPRTLVFVSNGKNPTKCVCQVDIISFNVTCSRHDIHCSWKIVHYSVLVTLWPRSGHNFEQHNKNLSSVNYLTIPAKIERAFIHLRSHLRAYVVLLVLKTFIIFVVWIKERLQNNIIKRYKNKKTLFWFGT